VNLLPAGTTQRSAAPSYRKTTRADRIREKPKLVDAPGIPAEGLINPLRLECQRTAVGSPRKRSAKKRPPTCRRKTESPELIGRPGLGAEIRGRVQKGLQTLPSHAIGVRNRTAITKRSSARQERDVRKTTNRVLPQTNPCRQSGNGTSSGVNESGERRRPVRDEHARGIRGGHKSTAKKAGKSSLDG